MIFLRRLSLSPVAHLYKVVDSTFIQMSILQLSTFDLNEISSMIHCLWTAPNQILRPCQAGMTNENKTSPVEKICLRCWHKIPGHRCCSVVFITWQDFGKQLEVLARLPGQKSASRASQVTYLHCAKLQPLDTLQVQNVTDIDDICRCSTKRYSHRYSSTHYEV